MTRGRRDGILKSEKVRNVVKIGPMHLKGVWYGFRTFPLKALTDCCRIPFERALEFANREKITDLLYPLFVHNIGGLLYDPQNTNRTNATVNAAERRRIETGPPRPPHMSQPPSLPHHNTMANPVGANVAQNQHSAAGRPSLDRAHTFPTPPTSASSVMGAGNSGSSYGDWSGQSMAGQIGSSQPLSIDTGLSNAARSMPTTPATTPPGNSMHNMHNYAGTQGYDTKAYYSGPPSQPSYPSQQGVGRYGQSNGATYVKNEMGPPSARSSGMPHDGETHDFKTDQYGQRPNGAHLPQHPGDSETDQDHEQDYMANGNHAYNAARGSFSYAHSSAVPNMPGDHSQMSPEMNGSPNNHNASGQVTPRTQAQPQSQWTGYHTPPRQPQSSSLYNMLSDSRGSAPNGATDGYGAPNYTTSTMNGTPSNKRGREDDDQDQSTRPTSSGLEPAFDLKRRRTMREDSVNSGVSAMPTMQPGIKAGGAQRRR